MAENNLYLTYLLLAVNHNECVTSHEIRSRKIIKALLTKQKSFLFKIKNFNNAKFEQLSDNDRLAKYQIKNTLK